MSDSPDDPGAPEIEAPFPDPTLEHFFSAHEELVSALRTFSLQQVTPIIGALLTIPDTQASTIRLEVLQHYVVATAAGSEEADASVISAWLNELGDGYVGTLEDAAEDVFVSRVSGPDADYLIFEGIYEGSAYYLQRFINVLEDMPDEEPFTGLRRSAHALLTLTDEVVRRAGLSAHIVGSVLPLQNVTLELAEQACTSGDRVMFGKADFVRLGVNEYDVRAFVFDLENQSVLREERLGHSSLAKTPLLRCGDQYCLALPSAVSVAIRRLIIEFCLSGGMARPLYQAYAEEFADAFSRTPILGGPSSAPVPFQPMGGMLFSSIARYVDQGRLLHICFVVDDFVGYEQSGIVDFRPDCSVYGGLINECINNVFETFQSKPEFREGLTLVVLCPWARPMAAQFEGVNDSRWRIEMVTASDLDALSWASSFSPRALWSLLDARDALARLGVELFNVNGLLNLYAWSEQLEGHLVPHGELPDEVGDGSFTIFIQQNSLLDIRRKGAQAWNVHRVRTGDGRTVQVRRYHEESIFEEDRDRPLYVGFDDVQQGRLVAVYETAQRGWWVTIETPEAAGRDLHYRLWHALVAWIERAADVLEARFPRLPDGPISWHCVFEDENATDPQAVIPDKNQAKALLEVKNEGGTVHVTAKQGFLFSFRHPTNVGESLLVEAFVAGVAALAKTDIPTHQIREALDEIVPSEWARDMHLFTAQRFRDFVGHNRQRETVLIEKADDALSRIGLGWRVRSREEGGQIVGVDDCCAYLNAVVDSIWQDIKASLQRYAREPVLLALVSNHEAISIESDRWLRTARSVLAFHDDKEDAARAATQQIAQYNGASLAARVLMEMALCECSDEGELPGRIDFSRLMANVMQMHYLGGWSEAIKYESKQAEIRVRPLGDVHTHIDFDDQVATPYGMALGKKRFQQGADSYEKSFGEEEPVKSAEGKIDDEFWKAWNETFGFTIDDLRVFMDNLEDEGVRLGQLMYIATEAELIALDAFGALPPKIVRNILELLTLAPRSTWASTPSGFSAKDWYPWRFRRRLSVISRPILLLSDDKAGRYLIAPGMVRDGAAKVIEYCHGGGYDAKVFPEGPMRSWIGSMENKRGHDFNKSVAEQFRKLGWEARSDIKLTEVLNDKLDRDYGDVDVLAWRDGRVIAVECKDLEMAMTNSDVARQLHDFRGELRMNGKPDRLRKHLSRMEVLKSRPDGVAKFVGHDGPVQIEAGLVFSQIVPMNFTSIASDHNVRLVTIDALHTI